MSDASNNGNRPLIRRLVHPAGGNVDADAPYPVPGEEKFGPDSKFIESPELEAIAHALTAPANDAELARSSRGLSIRYLWKATGGARDGAPVLGKCVKPSGLVRHFSDADFVIWLAADHLGTLNKGAPAPAAGPAATRWQVEACLYHELKHIGVEETEEGEERPVLVPHDLEEFNAVILRYGAWDTAVELAAAAFTQMPLFELPPRAKASIAAAAAASPVVRKAISDMQEAVGEGGSITVSAGGQSATLPGKAKERGRHPR